MYHSDNCRSWGGGCRGHSSRIDHECDTFNGQSGSPLWIYDPQRDLRTIIGVVSGGTIERGNYGKLLTPEDLDYISGWS